MPPILNAITALIVAAAGPVGCAPGPLPGEPNAARPAIGRPAEAGDEGRPDPVLVDLDGRPITLGEFEERAALASETARLLQGTTERRDQVLEKLIWMELLARSADREGLSGGPDEAILVADATVRARLAAQAASTFDRAAISEEWVQADYAERAPRDFRRPPRAQVWLVAFDDRAAAVAARAELEPLLRRGRADEVFPDNLARLGPSVAPPGGALGWVSSEDPNLPAVLRDAIFAADRGGLRDVVETAFGFAVVHVGRVVPGIDLSLDEVEADVRERLAQLGSAQLQRDALDAARTAVGVRVDDALVARLAAARVDGAATRPRRYEILGLATLPETWIGADQVRDAEARALADDHSGWLADALRRSSSREEGSAGSSAAPRAEVDPAQSAPVASPHTP